MSSSDDDEANQSFVPQSLLDTIQPLKRTYTSSRAAAGASSNTGPSTSRPRPSHAHSGSITSAANKEKARLEAAQMCATLGLDMDPSATPRPTRVASSSSSSSASAGSEGEVLKLKLALGDKENEVQSLRRELASLKRENGDLVRKNEKLEREKGGGAAGLGAREMEEVEKSFAAQEALLAGYQREVEKSHVTIETLKTQQRRQAALLEKLYGPNWETELTTHLDRPGSALPLPALSSSPAFRAPRTRPSLLASTSNLSRTSTESSRSLPPSPEPGTVVQSPLDAPASEAHREAQDALRAHVDDIQALLRGMERRLIARDVELESIEKKAKEANNVAQQRVLEVEQLLGKV